jgi:Holliday junction resolvase
MSNKKIKNATVVEDCDIKFKSKLEASMYKWLIEEGFNPLYEPYTFVIWEGFKPTIPFYDKDKHTRMLKLNLAKVISIKYTPDFFFIYNKLRVFIEAKGQENDVFYIKKKLFRKYLEKVKKEKGISSIYFEIFTKKQLLEALEIIKNYKIEEEGKKEDGEEEIQSNKLECF